MIEYIVDVVQASDPDLFRQRLNESIREHSGWKIKQLESQVERCYHYGIILYERRVKKKNNGFSD